MTRWEFGDLHEEAILGVLCVDTRNHKNKLLVLPEPVTTKK